MSNQNSTGNGSKLKALAIVAVLAVGALAAIFAASQAPSIASAQTDEEDDERSTVSTTGMATTKVDPDKVSLNIGVETDGANATDAITKNSELMDAVIAALRNAGVTDDEMSTGYFSVYPTYSYPPCIVKEEPANSTESGSTDPSTGMEGPDIYPYPDCQPTGVITGYKATNSLTVTLDASADVGAVIDAAVEAGANTVNGAYFFVSSERQEEIKDGLIADAIASARARADTAADAVNMTVTGVKSIHLQDVYFPVFDHGFAASESVARAAPILPGEQEISLTVQVTYFIG